MSTNLYNPADHRIYPARWPMYRGKQLFRIIDELSEDGKEELLSVSHITGITPRSQKNVTMFMAESLVGYKKCQVGDIAANTMWTWQGAIGVSAYAGVVSPAYNVYRQNGDYYNPRFLDMLLRERKLVDVYHSISTGIRPSRLRLYPDEFLTIRFPVPPKDEQDQIVRYLDWKMTGINKLIGIRWKQIKRLEELKYRSIWRATTKGLVTNVSLKESGNDWIGSIPTHWSLIVVKRAFSVILGKMLAPNPKSPDDTYEEYICAKDVHSDGVDLTKLKQMWFSPSEKQQYQVRCGDLLIVEGGAGAGNATVVKDDLDKDVFVQNSIHILRPKNSSALNEYLCYWINCLVKRNYMKHICSVATIPHYTKDKVLSTIMPLPPIQEQKAIVAYLNQICNRFDAIINNRRIAIQELQKLKACLISNVVTGKTDIRGIVVPEYEYVVDESEPNELEDLDEEMTEDQEE